MLKINQESEVYTKINGLLYRKDSEDICKDYFDNKKWIIKINSFKIAKSIHLSEKLGYIKTVEYEYTQLGCHPGKERTLYINSTHESFYSVFDPTIIGDGHLHQSINEEEPYVYFDDIYHKKYNMNNKFRAFNNQVSSFKDYKNNDLTDEDNKKILERDIFFGVKSSTYKVFEGLDYTFGVELETSSGRLTEKDDADLNLMCEFDGSLREYPDQPKNEVLGGEYVTGVLVGDTGMFHLQKICNKLSEKCTINNKCSVHVHIGNINFSKKVIVFLYILGFMLQDEIFSILPYSRRNNTYCKKLKDLKLNAQEFNDKTCILYNILIDEYYNIIFSEVYGKGHKPNQKVNKLFNHPNGSKCGYNKETQRYCWLNFVTAMCNTRHNTDAYTIEFRNMYATLNFIKIKNWIKLCFAFVNFAVNHQSSIIRGYYEDKCGVEYPININSILRAAYPKTYFSVEEYIQEKKDKFALDQGDIELLEYQKDKIGIKQLKLQECLS